MALVHADRPAQCFGLQSFSEREADGQPALDAQESLMGTFPAVSLVCGTDLDQGAGTLYISNRRVIWLSSIDNSRGYAVPFQSISLHAISEDPTVYKKPCIFAQLDPESTMEDHGEDSGDEDVDTAPDVKFIPEHTASLQDIFKVLCDCAALNPDSDMEDEEDAGEFYYDEDEVLQGAGAAARAEMLEHLDSCLVMPNAAEFEQLVQEDPDRFADPDDDEEDEHNHPHPMQH